jgi:hypothetical protein
VSASHRTSSFAVRASGRCSKRGWLVLELTARDWMGQERQSGGDPFQVRVEGQLQSITHQGGGRYRINVDPLGSARLEVHVTLQDERAEFGSRHVQGSPAVFEKRGGAWALLAPAAAAPPPAQAQPQGQPAAEAKQEVEQESKGDYKGAPREPESSLQQRAVRRADREGLGL